jgi:hypothetical protein
LLPKIEESSPKTVKIMITGADSTENRNEAKIFSKREAELIAEKTGMFVENY